MTSPSSAASALRLARLEHLLGNRQDVLLDDRLDERRDEVVVDDHRAVDLLLDVELGEPVGDRLRIGVRRPVREARPRLVDLEAAEAERRRALAAGDEPARLTPVGPQLAGRARSRAGGSAR